MKATGDLGRGTLWDPADEITRGAGRLSWCLTCTALVLAAGPSFVMITMTPLRPAHPNHVFLPDFFQDYASARNFRIGIDIYTEHDVTARLYLDGNSAQSDVVRYFRVNAHPPSSVLVFVPLACLDFAHAFLAWNLLSLIAFSIAILVITRELDIPLSPWSTAPAVSLALLCHPLWASLLNGQHSPVLLYLLVVTWAADRAGRQRTAGVFLALASSLKLFPALLLPYYAARGRWALVSSWAAASTAIASATIATFGSDIYIEYFMGVCPKLSWFRNSWFNCSTLGFWSRLFDTAPEVSRDFELARPGLYAPGLAVIATLASDALLLMALAISMARTRQRSNQDSTYGSFIVVMVLISPLSWPHSLLLLALPMAIIWRRMSATDPRRWTALSLALATLFLSPEAAIGKLLPRGSVASPIASLTILSIQFYALVGIYLILYAIADDSEQIELASSEAPPSGKAGPPVR